jgi:hypothetical protein
MVEIEIQNSWCCSIEFNIVGGPTGPIFWSVRNCPPSWNFSSLALFRSSEWPVSSTAKESIAYMWSQGHQKSMEEIQSANWFANCTKQKCALLCPHWVVHKSNAACTMQGACATGCTSLTGSSLDRADLFRVQCRTSKAHFCTSCTCESFCFQSW